MYPYIICYCGRSLGDIYDLFKALRREKYVEFFKKEGLNINPDKIPFAENVDIRMRDVFEQLNIDMPCCKTRLMSTVEYKELY
jgi:DNA-directed RNA polymerase subunit N (RpoN/RPB10)